MQLAKFQSSTGDTGFGRVQGDRLVPFSLEGSQIDCLADIFEAEDPREMVGVLSDAAATSIPLADVTLLAPIDRQEVWAAGVTYKRSRTARMEESETAASCYDRVYSSARPELFFKASPHRVAGPDQPLRIRQDSQWNVPEPELALVLNSRLSLVGFTVGNDMSSRDIEGENPLYLPQAKVYSSCCGLGPWVTLQHDMPLGSDMGIRMAVRRGDRLIFEGSTDVGQMARSLEDLISYLGRDNQFPSGAFLLTGTGIVPSDDFTLLAGDLVEISIDGIGLLCNPVVQG